MAKRKEDSALTPITSALNSDKIDCMASKLKALGHPSRIEILMLLEKNEKLPVGKIQSTLKLEQASTSNHLRILKDQGIVKSTRAGKNKLYSLKTTVLNDIISCIEKCKD